MKRILYLISLPVFFTTNSCKKPYSPPAIKEDYKFLAIDGALISNPDSPSVFVLTRTVRLTDSTFSSVPEKGATVSVEASTGEHYSCNEETGGIYKLSSLVLNSVGKYQLKILTASGGQYLSDPVAVQQTPPIDSITWHQANDVMIYVNTHDPSNNTHYYYWDFVETWQYRSEFDRTIAESNGVIYYVDSTNQTYNCWTSANSTNILTGSTVALSNDVIRDNLIETVPQNSDKIGIRYSILVKQYALDQAAYQYLEILKKNTEELGSIFDAQPTQLIGNIHSIKNPSEPVIGYFRASTVQQQRIFINRNEVTIWNPVDTGRSCEIRKIPQNPDNFLLYNYDDPSFAPYYFETAGSAVVLTRTSCVDCTVRGGTTTKPWYW